jgi:hypothetical protein
MSWTVDGRSRFIVDSIALAPRSLWVPAGEHVVRWTAETYIDRVPELRHIRVAPMTAEPSIAWVNEALEYTVPRPQGFGFTDDKIRLKIGPDPATNITAVFGPDYAIVRSTQAEIVFRVVNRSGWPALFLRAQFTW